jgi:glycosyltransferase involved in cell wall biosynthesis
MRILVPSIVDFKRAPPNRIHHLTRYLAANHQVTVLCINDWWRAAYAPSASSYYEGQEQMPGRVDVRYFTSRQFPSFFQEMCAPFDSEGGNWDDYDVIFNYNTLRSGASIARKAGLPMVFDLADDLPAMISRSPSIPAVFRPLGNLIGRWLVRQTVARASMVTATTPGFCRQFNIPAEQFTLLPNGVDTTLFRRVPTDLRQKWGLENTFLLGYIGVLREWVNLAPVLHALRDHTGAHLLLIGEEGDIESVRRLVRSLGVEDRIVFCGTIPHGKVPEYINAMDACLIPFDKNRIAQSAVPLKLFEYIACEKPVISTRLNGVMDTVGDRVLYADTYQEILECIRKLERSPWERGEEGRRFILAHHDWKPIGRKLESILIRTAGK